MVHNSDASLIFASGPLGVNCPLDWDSRMKIALDAARGLAYLHEDSQPCVIHRDFKASNILLENNFHAKVADFGLAKQAPEGRANYLSTRVMGTFGLVSASSPFIHCLFYSRSLREGNFF